MILLPRMTRSKSAGNAADGPRNRLRGIDRAATATRRSARRITSGSLTAASAVMAPALDERGVASRRWARTAGRRSRTRPVAAGWPPRACCGANPVPESVSAKTRVEAGRRGLGRTDLGATADCQHHGDSVGARPPGHADRGLAAEALGVETALAGDHHVDAGKRSSKPTRSRTTSIPDRWSAPRTADAANPTPPAAPVPARPASTSASPPESLRHEVGVRGQTPVRAPRRRRGSHPSAGRTPPPPRTDPAAGWSRRRRG